MIVWSMQAIYILPFAAPDLYNKMREELVSILPESQAELPPRSELSCHSHSHSLVSIMLCQMCTVHWVQYEYLMIIMAWPRYRWVDYFLSKKSCLSHESLYETGQDLLDTVIWSLILIVSILRNPFYIVTYYINCVKTSWTDITMRLKLSPYLEIFNFLKIQKVSIFFPQFTLTPQIKTSSFFPLFPYTLHTFILFKIYFRLYRRMSDSYDAAVIPLGSNRSLRDRYLHILPDS